MTRKTKAPAVYAIALLLSFSGAKAIAQGIVVGPPTTTLTGDCAASGTGSFPIVCTKTNGSTLGSMATQSATSVAITGGALTGTTVTLPGTTVATLPTCNSGAAGRIAFVTDALTPAALATLIGGGAVPVLAFCNGSTWVVG